MPSSHLVPPSVPVIHHVADPVLQSCPPPVLQSCSPPARSVSPPVSVIHHAADPVLHPCPAPSINSGPPINPGPSISVRGRGPPTLRPSPPVRVPDDEPPSSPSYCEVHVGPAPPASCDNCVPNLVFCPTHLVACGGESLICCTYCLRVLCVKHMYCPCKVAVERRRLVSIAFCKARELKSSIEFTLPRVIVADRLAGNENIPFEVAWNRVLAVDPLPTSNQKRSSASTALIVAPPSVTCVPSAPLPSSNAAPTPSAGALSAPL
jgi:hypothetical protein